VRGAVNLIGVDGFRTVDGSFVQHLLQGGHYIGFVLKPSHFHAAFYT
jgi:hypothetical protein